MKQRITMVIVAAIVTMACYLYRQSVQKVHNGKVQLQIGDSSTSMPFTGGSMLIEHLVY
jgi:hypothetical protein